MVERSVCQPQISPPDCAPSGKLGPMLLKTPHHSRKCQHVAFGPDSGHAMRGVISLAGLGLRFHFSRRISPRGERAARYFLVRASSRAHGALLGSIITSRGARDIFQF